MRKLIEHVEKKQAKFETDWFKQMIYCKNEVDKNLEASEGKEDSTHEMMTALVNMLSLRFFVKKSDFEDSYDTVEQIDEVIQRTIDAYGYDECYKFVTEYNYAQV